MDLQLLMFQCLFLLNATMPDQRAVHEHAELLAALGEREWTRVTGNGQDATSVPAKLAWLGRHEPSSLRAAHRVALGAPGYVVWRACGRTVCDPTTASTTGLFDLTARRWWPGAANAAAADTGLLPDLVDPATPAGRLSAPAARDLGLPTGLPILHAAGDAGATTLGVVGTTTESSYLYLGSSGWLAACVPSGAPTAASGALRLAHPHPGTEIRIGAPLHVASAGDWARRALLGDVDHEHAERAVAAEDSPTGVLFLPCLTGERAPVQDPFARGTFVGITPETTNAQLARAVMEGVALSLRHVAGRVHGGSTGTEEPAATEPLAVCGGGARSATWCQIIADALGRPLRRVHAADAAVRGAALLGWQAVGERPDVTAPAVGAVFEPDTERARHFAALAPVHRELYDTLAGSFRSLHELTVQR